MGGGKSAARRAALGVAAVTLLALVAAPSTPAQDDRAGQNDFGGFRNVLAVGQGETVNANELAANQASGQPPASFVNQLPLYRDLLYGAPRLGAGDIGRYFKPAGFGVPSAEVARESSPRPGVTIVRDRTYGVPHVYGRTRADTMFGAGYASGEDRLFLMDVLRHTGRARLSELIGPGENDSTVKMDAAQLKVADYSEEELQGMIDAGVRSAGEEGSVLKGDLDAYVAGVNAYIAAARRDANLLPGEYPALGKSPADWKPTDTVAVASLIGGIFGRGGGGEARAAQALLEAERRFRNRSRARRVFEDFRRADDPEAPVTTTRRFPFDNPGRVNPRAVALPDLGSIREEPSIQSREEALPSPPVAAAAGRSSDRSWLQRLQERGLAFPTEQSNALLVSRGRSRSGRPLAVTGPQVGYYSPMVLMELDLHGPGIDARGAAFPGISLYVLIGRGQDFSWSATTATTDVVDEFVERLCEPDGSPPSARSTHYLYKGRCRPFVTRDHVLRTTPGPLDLSENPAARPRTITLKVERSVHGPIQGRATVGGRPVAIAEARSSYFHELDSARAFKRLNGNEISDARGFQRAMNFVNFAFNWYYSDDRDILFFQSGWYPRRARGTDPSLPAWGTGEWDWQGFREAPEFSSRRMPFSSLPNVLNPSSGYIVNWNNKQAPGWRAADDNWAYGSVHRSERLERNLRRALSRGRRIDLATLTRIMALGGTIDLRGQEVYPLMRRLIGRTRDRELSPLLRALDVWVRRGAHRRDLNRNNVYEDSQGVVLMDAWWPLMTRRIFEPALGSRLMGRFTDILAIDDTPDMNANSSFFDGWWGYVDKDLRSLLRQRVRGPLSRRYCGGGSARRCRSLLVSTLREAAAQVRRQQGSDMRNWREPATCEVAEPKRCDQLEFTTAGGVSLDPIPYQDRGGFQQVVEVQGHRPR